MPSAASHRSHPQVFFNQIILSVGNGQARFPLRFLLGLSDLGR